MLFIPYAYLGNKKKHGQWRKQIKVCEATAKREADNAAMIYVGNVRNGKNFSTEKYKDWAF